MSVPATSDACAPEAYSTELPPLADADEIRTTRSSAAIGLPLPSRLLVVSHSAPSPPATTERSRPYLPCKTTLKTPTVPVPLTSAEVRDFPVLVATSSRPDSIAQPAPPLVTAGKVAAAPRLVGVLVGQP